MVARRILALATGFWLAGCGGGGGSNGDGDAQSLIVANRAPLLASIPDLSNSPYSYETTFRPTVSDPDDDAVRLSVAVANSAIARAHVVPSTGEIVLEPLRPGASEITVTADDGQLSATVSFVFHIGEVTKVVEASADPGEGGAVSLLNSTNRAVDFVLTHNGFRTFQSIDEMIEFVLRMPAEIVGETFPRKLWRFVRDNVYHWPFISPNPWLMNPLVQINSVGWGFCTGVAAAYVELARAAGYEARVWAIGGHVVAEIRTASGWAVFDPDLAVYYHTTDGRIASVADLANDPSLVSSPVDPLFPDSEYGYPYTASIASIYGTQNDNAIWSSLLPTVVGQSGRVSLPPGARLTYQGKWTEPPVGIDDAGQSYEVPEFRQSALTLAPGWTGTVALPWLPWDVQGVGVVRIGGTLLQVGSDALRQRLRRAGSPIHELEIIEAAGELRIVFLINPARYEVLPENVIELTGMDVWRVVVGTEELPPEVRPGPKFSSAYRKPVPMSL